MITELSYAVLHFTVVPMLGEKVFSFFRFDVHFWYKMYFLTKSVNLKIVLVSSPMKKNCLLTIHAN